MDQSPVGPETYASYYARYLRTKGGYSADLVPELEGLATVCDYVLVRRDGRNFSVAAIVDRERNPKTRFASDPEQIRAIADVCDRYSGTVRDRQLKAIVTVYEIGPDVIDVDAKARLAQYKRENRHHCFVFAWLLDTATTKAWTNRPLAFLGPRQRAERKLRAPRLRDSDLVPKQYLVPAPLTPPYFTFALIVLLLAIFFAEVVLAQDPTTGLLALSPRSLLGLGALSRPAIVDHGQWWRLVTAPLLHLDASHVGFNCLGLFLIGRLLEPQIGWRWMAAIFSVSAVCGSLLSLAINPPNLVGIGASGGIVGLFAAAILTATRLPSGAAQARLMRWAIYGLLPALLPFLNGAASHTSPTDYGAHFGGAIGGLAVCSLLTRFWPGGTTQPSHATVGGGVAAVYFAAAIVSLLPLSKFYQEQGKLDPNFPTTITDRIAQSNDLALKYPHDPRVLLSQAGVLAMLNQRSKAEVAINTALAETDILHDMFPPELEADLRSVQAEFLQVDGKPAEAKAAAAPACTKASANEVIMLKHQSLCP